MKNKLKVFFAIILVIMVVLFPLMTRMISKDKKQRFGEARWHNKRAIDYLDMGELDKAVKEAREGIRLDPKYAKLYVNLGGAYIEKGMFLEAEKTLKKAIELNPKLYEAHINLGILYARMGQDEERVREFKLAIAINPLIESVHYDLGVNYLMKDWLSDAKNEFEQVLKINPHCTPAQEYLDMIAKRLSGEKTSYYYTVKTGDCLWSIAAKSEIYHDPLKWIELHKDNKSKIKNPNLIYPGQILSVPRR